MKEGISLIVQELKEIAKDQVRSKKVQRAVALIMNLLIVHIGRLFFWGQ